jgi:predicted kinase|nr:AAA family ATPase [Spirochaetales bacterium]
VPKVYLMSGRTGAGKTVLSKQMATEKRAFRISHDEWLRKIYGAVIQEENFSETCDNVSELIWVQVEALCELGVSVILEGWGSRILRDKARKKLEALHIDFEFIFVECPADERWLRVQKRNQSAGEEGFHISKEDFDRMESIREEFDDDEPVTVIDNSGHNLSLPASGRRSPQL